MVEQYRFTEALEVVRAYQSGDAATGNKLFKEYTLGDEHEEQCVHCGQDTRVSGYVNRIPADMGDATPFPSARIMCGSCVSEGDFEMDGERAMNMMNRITDVMNDKELQFKCLSFRQAIVNVYEFDLMEGLLELDSKG